MLTDFSLTTWRFRNQRTVAASVLVHLGILGAIVLSRPAAIRLEPQGLAFGSGSRSYRVIYAATVDETSAAPEPKLVFARPALARPSRAAVRSDPKHDHLQVSPEAEVASQDTRAGSPLGTLIDGPIEGHEVHVAFPVVFPDPPVARSEIPAGVQGDVIVEVTIDAQGNVVDTKLVQPLGHGIDEKILATLRQWHYQPATLDGTPVVSIHDVHFHFPS